MLKSVPANQGVEMAMERRAPSMFAQSELLVMAVMSGAYQTLSIESLVDVSVHAICLPVKLRSLNVLQAGLITSVQLGLVMSVVYHKCPFVSMAAAMVPLRAIFPPQDQSIPVVLTCCHEGLAAFDAYWIVYPFSVARIADPLKATPTKSYEVSEVNEVDVVSAKYMKVPLYSTAAKADPDRLISLGPDNTLLPTNSSNTGVDVVMSLQISTGGGGVSKFLLLLLAIINRAAATPLMVTLLMYAVEKALYDPFTIGSLVNVLEGIEPS